MSPSIEALFNTVPTPTFEPKETPPIVTTVPVLEEPLKHDGPVEAAMEAQPKQAVKETYAEQAPVLVHTASLHGKVALVTGGSRGIGAGIALSLARRGASIAVNYVSSKGPAQALCEEIEALGTGARATAIQADVARGSEITRLFEETISQLGKIDIVMSNSGMESWDDTATITEDKFDAVFGLNAKAQFFVGQAALKYCQPGGRLILMSSIAAGLMGVKDHALYNASKMAVLGMMKSFATDFAAKKGITCNAVCPGGIKSDMFTTNAWRYIPGATPDWDADRIESAMAGHCPLGRCAVPEDVGRVVGFLCSEDGGWINGQAITISGGSGQ